MNGKVGYFSHRAVALGNAVFIYTNERGEEVQVTCVENENEHTYTFEDAVFVGKVVKYIRTFIEVDKSIPVYPMK